MIEKMQKKQIIDKVNILKNRYPEEEEGVLLLACYLDSKVERAKECKEKLETCIDYRDIAQKVVRPLYVNCDIDEEKARSKGLLMTLLPLTVYGKQGKYNSLLYHISLMLTEKEVKEQRRKSMAQRNAPQLAEKTSSGSDVATYTSDDSPWRVVLRVPAGMASAALKILKGMEEGALIQIASAAPCQQTRLMGRKMEYTILGESVNVVRAIEKLQVWAGRSQRQFAMSRRQSAARTLPLSKRLSVAKRYRSFYVATASSDIVVSLPRQVVGGLPQGVGKRNWKFANVMPPGISLSGMSEKQVQAGRARKLLVVDENGRVCQVVVEKNQTQQDGEILGKMIICK